MAVAHMPHEMEICAPVALLIKSTTKGLGAVAVINIEQQMMLAW